MAPDGVLFSKYGTGQDHLLEKWPGLKSLGTTAIKVVTPWNNTPLVGHQNYYKNILELLNIKNK